MVLKFHIVVVSTLLAFIASSAAYADQTFTSNNAQTSDGNSLVIDGKTLPLYAIDAPHPGTFCDASRKKYDCGKMARSSLLDLTAGSTVVCKAAGKPHKTNSFRCLSNGYDLSEGMVYTGWATPSSTAPKLFDKLARQAKEKRHGMWRLMRP